MQGRIVLLFCFLMMLDIVVQIYGAEFEGDGIEGNLRVDVKMLNIVHNTIIDITWVLTQSTKLNAKDRFKGGV